MERLFVANFGSIETQDKANFGIYRNFIDKSTYGYRKLGLLDPIDTARAIEDNRTILLETRGINLPIIIPIDYVSGYDPSRCRELSRSSGECFYLSITSQMLSCGLSIPDITRTISKKLKTGDSIFFDYSKSDIRTQKLLSLIFEPISSAVERIDLKDPKGKKEVQQASMALYSSKMKLLVPGDSYRGKAMHDIYKDYVNVYPKDGYGVYSYNTLTPELIDKLWLLFKERFNKLGECHPLSMEDTRETYDELLRQDGVLLPVCFRNNEPEAMSLVFTNIDSCTWLNSDYLKKINLHYLEEEFMFFGAIAARENANTGSFMKEIVFKFTKDLATIGKDIWLLYETSNRSEQYIPKYTDLFIKGAGWFTLESNNAIDRHLYEGFVIK